MQAIINSIIFIKILRLKLGPLTNLKSVNIKNIS